MEKNDEQSIRYCGQLYRGATMRVDEWLHHQLFRNWTGGRFIECGALDGVSISNCLFLERYLGWSGINIECSCAFERLAENRPDSLNLRFALSDTDGDFLTFYEDVSNLAQSASDLEFVPAEHQVKKVSVKTIRYRTLVDKYRIESVDFMSLDVEGMESRVLDGMIGAKVLPRYILIEILHSDRALIDTKLSALGFSFIDGFHIDALYARVL